MWSINCVSEVIPISYVFTLLTCLALKKIHLQAVAVDIKNKTLWNKQIESDMHQL